MLIIISFSRKKIRLRYKKFRIENYYLKIIASNKQIFINHFFLNYNLKELKFRRRYRL